VLLHPALATTARTPAVHDRHTTSLGPSKHCKMADTGNIGSARTLKRKNVKNLALTAPTPRAVQPSESDSQVPGGNGNDNGRQTDQLQIGIEYKLDLKREDLEVLKDLGHGNGGTVSKVRHTATNTIMARKVSRTIARATFQFRNFSLIHRDIGHPRGSKRRDAKEDRPRVANYARYQFRVYCQFLWCLLE
jgi:hypothetical protein